MVMPPKQQAPLPDVVEIDSSDDEGAVVVVGKYNSKNSTPKKNSRNLEQPLEAPKIEKFAAEIVPSGSNYLPLASRSFWKAGDYEIGPTKPTYLQDDLEHARVHPKFLHTNATSHKWAFGAIAELLDNAVDEISNGATFVKVDKIINKRDNSPALIFQDDGGGMNPERIRKCMSLGYSSKTSNTTIGQYGNGFKTSTMRLGADVIVFSRASQSGRVTQSVGLLSYTFLRKTGQDDVIVPMIDFEVSNHWPDPIIYSSQDDWSANLKTILEWSPFPSKDDLMLQFHDMGLHGTKIIIFNLWLNDEGIYELNFDDDDEDIKLRDESNRLSLSKPNKKVLEIQSHISYRLRYSLQAYTSILYKSKFTNFKIILRGKPVEQYDIVGDLKFSKKFTYRPQLAGSSNEVLVETIVGFVKEEPCGISGLNVYHKNRLIRPFWKVTGDGSSRGNGVVGVLEANFIQPAHDKQDFERSSLFFKLEMRLKQTIMEYWKGHCHLIGYQPEGSRSQNMQNKSTAQVSKKLADMQMQGPNDKTGHSGHSPAKLEQNLFTQESVNQGSTCNEVENAVPINDIPPGFVQGGTHKDCSSSASIEQLCEENIQVFIRCQEYEEKENELKRTIDELEKELEQTKMKCAKLSLHLESQRKQSLVNQQTQKI